jgi:hypothetical protein
MLSHRYFCSQYHIFAEHALTVYDNQYFLEQLIIIHLIETYPAVMEPKCSPVGLQKSSFGHHTGKDKGKIDPVIN